MQASTSPPGRIAALRAGARRWIPFPIRTEWVRIRRWPTWIRERNLVSLAKAPAVTLESWHGLAEYQSPLRRSGVSNEALQIGKERNVALAAQAIDGIVLQPRGECFAALKPGGLSSHVFDHRDHLYHADKRYPFLNHLRFSDAAYRVFFGHRLLFHNRILPEEVIRAFCDGGFELVSFRRLVLPSGRYAESGDEVTSGLRGLNSQKLHPRFRAASEADLYTAAAHYLFRKPK